MRIHNRALLALNLGIFLIYSFIYYPSLQSPPFWDDYDFIFGGHTPISLGAKYSLRTSWPVFYFIIYWIKSWFGQNFHFYHLLSVILHLVNAVLISFLTKEYLGRKKSWCLGALFLLHPMNYFVVSWIIQIKTILSVLFFLLSLFFLKAALQKNKGSWAAGSIFFYFLSAFTKSMLITAIVPIIGILYLTRNKMEKVLKHSVAFSLIIISFLAYQSTVHGWKIFDLVHTVEDKELVSQDRFDSRMGEVHARYFKEMNLRYSDSVLDRVIRYLVVTGSYLTEIVFPGEPQFFPVPKTHLHSGSGFIKFIYVLVALSLGVLIFFLARKKEVLAVGLLLTYLFTAFPFSHTFFIPLYSFTDHVHYWIYPFIAFFLAATILLLSSKLKPGHFNILMAGIIVSYTLSLFEARAREGNFAEVIIGQHDYRVEDAFLVYDLYAIELLEAEQFERCADVYTRLENRFPFNGRIRAQKLKCQNLINK